MKKQAVIITIRGTLTSLNEYINAERSSYHAAAKIKRENTALVTIQSNLFDPIANFIAPPYKVSFIWYCDNQKKDIDNIAFAKKFIFDGLIKSGIIPGDGWEIIREFGGEKFHVDPADPRVTVIFTESKCKG